MIDWKSVGQLLRAIRRQRRISYRELASRAGVARGTVLRIEAGLPSLASTITKLEKALNLTQGVLTHSAPIQPGDFFIQDKTHEFIHLRPNPKYTKRLPEYSQKMLRDPRERLRIGKLGFISAFQWESDLGLENSLMRPTLIELYDATTPNEHEGEEMVFGVRGTSLVKLGQHTLVIHENQSATFWPKNPHSYAPDPGSVPSLLLSVRIDRTGRGK